MKQEPGKKGRDWREEVVVTGSELVERVKKLVAEGNVRRVIIRNKEGNSLLEIPLTAGVAVGGAVTIMAPVLAALGALAALLSEFRVEVVGTRDSDE
ncbi:MAG: DUF4342 domain-containing protein [Candidatus Competibacteraceae bacterium]|jgi:hypothetical protein|nr:DUF4342 domain-containing protein [Candidatus Competibacteraceae bacterium]